MPYACGVSTTPSPIFKFGTFNQDFLWHHETLSEGNHIERKVDRKCHRLPARKLPTCSNRSRTRASRCPASRCRRAWTGFRKIFRGPADSRPPIRKLRLGAGLHRRPEDLEMDREDGNLAIFQQEKSQGEDQFLLFCWAPSALDGSTCPG